MKNKKTLSSFMAAVIAVCMMLQFVPAFGNVPTAQAADPVVAKLAFAGKPYAYPSWDGPEDAKITEDGWELVTTGDGEVTNAHSVGFGSADGTIQMLTASLKDKDEQVVLRFNIPEDGIYDMTALSIDNSNSWKSVTADVIVDGKLVKNLQIRNNKLADAIGKVELVEGEHTLIIRRTTTYSGSGDNYNILQLDNITFTKVEDLVSGPVIKFDGLTDDTLKTKKITADSPWELDTAKTSAGSLKLYNDTLDGGSTAVTYLSSTHINFKQSDGSWNYQTLSFKIKIDEDGLYDLSSVFFLVDAYWSRAMQISIKIDGVPVHEGVLSSKAQADLSDAKTLESYNLSQVALKKGYHNISITDGHASSDKYQIFLNSLIFNRVGDITTAAPAEVSDNFGENYAYVRESYVDGEKVYNVIFLGGIKEITEYSKVGFEYSTDGGVTWNEKLSDKVYESLEFSDGKLYNNDFGTEYIFYSDVELSNMNISSAVTFRACAVKADGDKVYGVEYTVPVNK